MKEIELTQDKVARVDDWMFAEQAQFSWHALKGPNTWYAVREVTVPGASQKAILMHRAIMHAPLGVKIDHWDRDGLNNQTYNLREATQSQNGANRGKQADNKSGYKGVSWDAESGRWRAQIKVEGRKINLKRFGDKIEAAYAYDLAAREYFGEFAALNFPKESAPDKEPA